MSRLRTAAAVLAGLILGAGAGAAFWALTGPLTRSDMRLGA